MRVLGFVFLISVFFVTNVSAQDLISELMKNKNNKEYNKCADVFERIERNFKHYIDIRNKISQLYGSHKKVELFLRINGSNCYQEKARYAINNRPRGWKRSLKYNCKKVQDLTSKVIRETLNTTNNNEDIGTLLESSHVHLADCNIWRMQLNFLSRYKQRANKNYQLAGYHLGKVESVNCQYFGHSDKRCREAKRNVQDMLNWLHNEFNRLNRYR